MVHIRMKPSAFVLQNGHVLVAGGTDLGILDNVELSDPSTSGKVDTTNINNLRDDQADSVLETIRLLQTNAQINSCLPVSHDRSYRKRVN